MNWISVKDKNKRPKLEQAVLVFCPDWCQEGYDIATIDEKSEWTNSAGQDMDDFVTHWQKISPPKITTPVKSKNA